VIKLVVTEILQHLGELYGQPVASAVAERLTQRMELFRSRPRRRLVSAPKIALDQTDALLITYADQLHEPGRRPLETLTDFARAHLRDMMSAIHLLPFYPWSSDDGFAVKDYLAVDPACGTWAEIARLGQDFILMFDAVFNHLSAEGLWFRGFLAGDPRFRDFFLRVDPGWDLSKVIRPRALPLVTEFQAADGRRPIWTTFSADQPDLDYRNPEVLLAVLDVLLSYVEQGAQWIRLDAIAFLWKEPGTTCLHLPQTHHVIQLMRSVLNQVAPTVLLITETNVPHRDNLSYFGDGTNEAQLVYNFALPPLVLHSFQVGNASVLSQWAASLALPSDRVTFLNFLSSHDGIGLNPARGLLSDAEIQDLVARTLTHDGFISYRAMPGGSESPYEMNINYLDALSNPKMQESPELATRKFLTAHAILFSLAGVPAVYFHSLFGSRGDRAAAEATGIKRRINREKLERARIENELANPSSLRARIFRGLGEQLQLRRRHAAFAPAAGQRVLELDPRVFAILRESNDGSDRMLCLHNVSAEAVHVRVPGMSQDISLASFDTHWMSLDKSSKSGR